MVTDLSTDWLDLGIINGPLKGKYSRWDMTRGRELDRVREESNDKVGVLQLQSRKKQKTKEKKRECCLCCCSISLSLMGFFFFVWSHSHKFIVLLVHELCHNVSN